jgi:hypothetical protein
MDPITSRNRSRSVSADAYWRRRLFALAAGLAVLGLLVWAVGGASAHPTAATTPLHHHDAPNPSGPATGGSPTPLTSPSPSPSPSATGHAQQHAHHGKHGRQGAKPKAKHTPPPAAAGAHSHGGDCQSADVVLTLTASSNSYGAAGRPEFGVDVVSTAPHTCKFNVGTRHVTLLIKSGGVRVWNSADCAGKSGASSVAKLKRGVPLQLQMTWNRRLSSPGCQMPQAEARPGAYTVTAFAGDLHSHTLVFDLR